MAVMAASSNGADTPGAESEVAPGAPSEAAPGAPSGAMSGGFARHGWIVTDDVLYEGPGDPLACEVGTVGPVNIAPEVRERLDSGHGVRWSVWDDDDVLYYRGRIVLPDDASEQECLSPLREFALGYGAVKLTFRDKYGTHTYDM